MYTIVHTCVLIMCPMAHLHHSNPNQQQSRNISGTGLPLLESSPSPPSPSTHSCGRIPILKGLFFFLKVDSHFWKVLPFLFLRRVLFHLFRTIHSSRVFYLTFGMIYHFKRFCHHSQQNYFLWMRLSHLLRKILFPGRLHPLFEVGFFLLGSLIQFL